MDSVLVGVDHSDSSRRAVRFALERAQLNGWRVTIAHVVNWSPYAFHPPEDNEARPRSRRAEIEAARTHVIEPIMSWIAAEGLGEGVELHSLVRHGRPSEVLADVAEADGHDLVVVGRTGESNLRQAIFGSTAYRLVQHAPVPVVVIP